MDIRIFFAGDAVRELLSSGLLQDSEPRMPIKAQDVVRWLGQPSTFALIGSVEGSPVGYVVGMMREVENGVRELFLLQTYNAGTRDYVDAGLETLERFGRELGCARLAGMIPLTAQGQAQIRRFHYTPVAVYCIREIPRGAH